MYQRRFFQNQAVCKGNAMLAVFMRAARLGLLVAISWLASAFVVQDGCWARTTKQQSEKEKSSGLYRIDDDQGNTIFTDRVPVELNQYRQERLNAQGRVVHKKERAQSKEQQLMEARLAALRIEQQKIIARQKMHDEALLSTYHSESDLAKALQVKSESFDLQKKSLESKLNGATHQLDNYLKVAAQYERSGEKVPHSVAASIALSQKAITQIQEDIRASLDKKKLTEREYQADIERYLFLTQSSKKTRGKELVPSVKEANLLGLFYCDNDHQCNKAWHLAHDFINQYSTTPPDIFNEKLIMNRPPATNDDISLSLSRISLTDKDYLLFLDILCHDSEPGRELCASDRVREIRSKFRPYMNDVLARTRQ